MRKILLVLFFAGSLSVSSKTGVNITPLLYLRHDIGGDEYEWYCGGCPDIILDNLYADGKLADMVVVLTNGRGMKDYDSSGGGDDMAPDRVH
jgi:hypothetical protein